MRPCEWNGSVVARAAASVTSVQARSPSPRAKDSSAAPGCGRDPALGPGTANVGLVEVTPNLVALAELALNDEQIHVVSPGTHR